LILKRKISGAKHRRGLPDSSKSRYLKILRKTAFLRKEIRPGFRPISRTANWKCSG
jgi:hypothetical protein